MSFGNKSHPDPDDFFADSRMSFGDHLEELRLHLWRAIAGFGVALIFGFIVGQPVMRFLSSPAEAQLQKYWERYYQKKNREIKELIENKELDQGSPIAVTLRVRRSDWLKEVGKGKKAPEQALDIIPTLTPLFRKLGIEQWLDQKAEPDDQWIVLHAQIANPVEMLSEAKLLEPLVGKKPSLSTLSLQEGFLGWVKVSMVAAFVLASPWIFYQIWAFIAAGLYPHEKRYVNVFLPISIGLFLVGCILCQYFVIPKAIGALLWFNEWLELEPDFRWNEWLSFALFTPVVFGLAFQTPLVMLFLERTGILTVESFRAKRRVAWFVMTLLGALLLPTTDIQSLLMLCVPMCFLYELGIWACIWLPKPPGFDMDVPETDELIEV
jgi:sec-independent protein translocase protein TatC